MTGPSVWPSFGLPFGGICDHLLLNSGVHLHPFQVLGRERPSSVCHRKALLPQRRDLFFVRLLAPARERRAIKRQMLAEARLPAKAPEVPRLRTRRPALAQRLVGEVVHVPEKEQTRPRAASAVAATPAPGRTSITTITPINHSLPNSSRAPNYQVGRLDLLRRTPTRWIRSAASRSGMVAWPEALSSGRPARR